MQEVIAATPEATALPRTNLLRGMWRALQPGPEGAPEGDEVLTQKVRQGVLARFTVVAVLLLALFALVVRQIYLVQVKRHEEFLSKSLAVCRRRQVQVAPRGRILDLQGNVFACDVASRNVFAEPKRFAYKIPQVAAVMARHLEMDEGVLRERLERAARYEFGVTLAEQASLEFVRAHRLGEVPGVGLQMISNAEGQPSAFRVTFRPSRVGSTTRRHSLGVLAAAFGKTPKDLEDECMRAAHRCQEIQVKCNVSREAVERMEAELRSIGTLAGFRSEDAWVRTYPRDNELANMLGYLNENRVGVSGIEALMERFLRPTPGRFTFKHDRRGRPVEEGVSCEVAPVNGADVYLTIQEPVQQIVEEELRALCESSRPDRAYAIMVDPTTGAVMALAQYPQFNPNDRKTLTNSDLIQNHCLIQSYDPGSIMKAISLSGLLDRRVARLQSMVFCENGHWQYGGKLLRDSHGYGELTFAEVIQKSSNIGTAKFALRLGEEGMFKHLDGFGFGRRTGLGFYPEGQDPVVFPSEAKGQFRALRNWDKLTITRMPMGQGISMTPIQIVQGWMALANHGVIMQPYIIDHVRYADGRVEYSQPRVKSTPLTPVGTQQMLQALKLVTKKGGTGTRAAVKGYEVAGKTGTAQLCLPEVVGVDKDGKPRVKYIYSSTKYLASFVGFVPADQPRFLLLVTVEHPTSKMHTGGGVSAPVFGKIAARTLEYLQVPPTETEPADTRVAKARR